MIINVELSFVNAERRIRRKKGSSPTPLVKYCVELVVTTHYSLRTTHLLQVDVTSCLDQGVRPPQQQDKMPTPK
jgi:hypothetical protein